jgi:hypothetical protein
MTPAPHPRPTETAASTELRELAMVIRRGLLLIIAYIDLRYGSGKK